MSWARVDDGWWSHPKVLGLSLPARGLWVTVLSWSCQHRTSLVPAAVVSMVGGPAAGPPTAELVDAGLWHGPGHDCGECPAVDDGWVIHDWREYQERSLREKRAEAGRKGGLRSAEVRAGSASEAPSEANAKQTVKQNRLLESSKLKQTGEANGQAGARPVPSRPDLNPCADTSAQKQPELATALATACRIDPDALTDTARQALHAAANQLARVGATPDQIPPRASRYRTRWPNVALTPHALVKHWPALTDARAGPAPPTVGTPEWDRAQAEQRQRVEALAAKGPS